MFTLFNPQRNKYVSVVGERADFFDIPRVIKEQPSLLLEKRTRAQYSLIDYITRQKARTHDSMPEATQKQRVMKARVLHRRDKDVEFLEEQLTILQEPVIVMELTAKEHDGKT